MPDRFYVPGEWADRVEIDGQEGQHLSRVLRAAPGDVIEVFNGTGTSAAAVVETVRKQAVTVRLIPPQRQSDLPAHELILAVAAPKGDRFSWLIEKATELGVDRFIPLSTERSVVKPSDQKLHKGEQTVITACKQCGRNRLMKIDNLCLLSELNRNIDFSQVVGLVGDQHADPDTTTSLQASCVERSVLVIVGPEGGLTSSEQESLDELGVHRISLSPFILRIETAAIAFASWVSACRLSSPGGNL